MLSQWYNDAKIVCTFNGGKNTAFSGHETFTKILDGVIQFITPVHGIRNRIFIQRTDKNEKKGKHVA